MMAMLCVFLHIAPSLIGIAMLPEQALRVSWQPATDVKDHSLVEVETQFGNLSQTATANSTVSVLSISGLPKYATGVVTVLSKNPSAPSQAITIPIRTITIDTNGELRMKHLSNCDRYYRQLLSVLFMCMNCASIIFIRCVVLCIKQYTTYTYVVVQTWHIIIYYNYLYYYV